MSRPLGYRGQQVLAFVTTAIEQGERSPSYAMIADALGMNSIADVCNVIRRLERRGLLKRERRFLRDKHATHNGFRQWRRWQWIVLTPTTSGHGVL